MRFTIHEEEIEKWNSACEIIEKAVKHEPHAHEGIVQIYLEDKREVFITYESMVMCLTATIDLEVSVADKTGRASVKARSFCVFAKCTKDKMVISTSNSEMIFKSGRSENKIGLVEDFDMNEIYTKSMAEVDFQQLYMSISKVKTSLKSDENRMVADKVNFFSKDSGRIMMSFATDGHRMFCHSVKMPNPIKADGFALHMKSIDALLEILEHYKDSPVQMWDIQDSYIYFIAPDITMRIPLLQAMSIDPLFFRNSVIDSMTSNVVVSTKKLKAALKKCSTAQSLKSKDAKNNARVTEQGIVMFVEDESLVLGVAGQGFIMIEDIDAESSELTQRFSDDKLCRASLRIKYLSESVREIESPSVRIRWSAVDIRPTDGLQAVVVSEDGNDDSFSVIMMVKPGAENESIKPSR